MSNQKAQTLKIKPLPPKIPEDLQQLMRAITLLGSRVKASLTNKPQQELIELIGYYPNEQEASLWKKELTQIRKARTTTTSESDTNKESN